MDQKTRETAIGFVVQGMQLWHKQTERQVHRHSPSAWLPSVSIDQIAERVVDNLVELWDIDSNGGPK